MARRTGKTPVRGVRVTDDLWRASQRTAKRRGEDVPDAIRDFLAEYAREELFAAPQIRSEYDADGALRHRDATGREYTAVTVDGEVTYQPTDTEGE